MTWRDLLAEIISDPEEEQRIAQEVEVHRITLGRWASGEHTPVKHKLRKLLNAVPEHYREQFRQLIAQEYQDFFSSEHGGSREIPSTFYALTLVALRDTSNRFWTVCSMVLQSAAIQLDPMHDGLQLIVARCMPPRPEEGKVRSLREVAGLGTKRHMRNDLQSRSLFLGAESLAGYAVSTFHQGVVQNLDEDHSLLPVHQVKDEKRAAAFPLIRERKVAGSLVATSTQIDFFTPSRLKLLDLYVDLLAEAFHEEEYLSPSCIELRVMPPYEVQIKAYATFRDRVNALLAQDSADQEGLNSIQAELLVRQQLEEEFLRQNEGLTASH